MRGRERATPPHLRAEDLPPPDPTIDLDDAGDTPILREYRAVKAEHPDALVLARLGDFYELFGADAELAAPILEVTLTGRGFGSAGRLPMCGVPHQAVAAHLRRLLDAGHRVVLWDQVGEVVAGRLVRREVTRVLSPGTAVDADLLEPTRVARLVALAETDGQVGVAALDLAGGELVVTEVAGGFGSVALRDELERLDVAELLVGDPASLPPALLPGAVRTALPVPLFDGRRGAERLASATGTASLIGLGLEEMPVGVRAAGAVLGYCERARVALEPGLLRVVPRQSGELMRLDPPTRRNLELLEPLGSGPSLAQLLDRTRTPMGARLLRRRLQEPLTEPGPIGARLEGVAALVADRPRREELRRRLGSVRDLERLVGRAVQGLATPRDLGAIREACAALPAVARLLEDLPGELAGLAGTAVPPGEVGDPPEGDVRRRPAPDLAGGWLHPRRGRPRAGPAAQLRRRGPRLHRRVGGAGAGAHRHPLAQGRLQPGLRLLPRGPPRPPARRCHPTTCASRRWSAPSATSPLGSRSRRASC